MRQFPKSMTERRQWITWTLTSDGKKIPNGKSNDPSTWTDYESIKNEPRIAYVFHESDPFVGIDLDDCIDENGTLNEAAFNALSMFENLAYCEVSQSGRGLHFIVRGKKPDWSVCSRNGVECYEHGRFWVMTGDLYYYGKEPTEPQECQEQLEAYLDKYLRIEQRKPVSIMQIISESKLMDRMIDYADAVPASSEGGRNQTLFSLAGHLWAMRGDDGSPPSLADVKQVCERWNSRCSPPLDERELSKTIENAREKGSPREEKPSGSIALSMADIIEGGEIADRLWPTLRSEQASEDDDSDVDFCLAMLPDDGLLRLAYDYYWDLAIRPSPIMGMAVAISLMEVLLGRKVATHTDLRSNDYNLVIAQTASGKEACKSAITRILDAAGASQLLMAADVQSGNGLITAMVANPCSIWIGDEFGKVLQGILDKKGSQHLKNIGKHLLSLYGESSGRFLGAAHAAGSKNEIDQPHLCILGLSTGSTIFDGITADHVSDGLLNRISFWPVQERPKRKRGYSSPEINSELVRRVGEWFAFIPGQEAKAFDGDFGQRQNLADINSKAVKIRITPDAQERWEEHSFAIDAKMEAESSQRSAMWGRTAARSLMLAMVHRCSRLPSPAHVGKESIEIQDVNWGIRLSNWLSRIACDLVEQNMIDKSLMLAKKVLEGLDGKGPIPAREALRMCRSLTSGDLDSAATKLGFEIEYQQTSTRKKKFYIRKKP